MVEHGAGVLCGLRALLGWRLLSCLATRNPWSSFSGVEEERSLFVKLNCDRVEQVELTIPEPSRLFASYLVGRDPREAPAIIERLCGKCPVSYQIPACEVL